MKTRVAAIAKRSTLIAAVALIGLARSAFAQETPAPQPSPAPAPSPSPDAGSDGKRLNDLERKLDDQSRKIDEQQHELDELKREKLARELRQKPLDEKSGVQSVKPPSAAQFAWGYDDGFFVKGDIHDQPYLLRPTARLQLDYRAFPHAAENDVYHNHPPTDDFLIRRARIGFLGTFSVFGFDFEGDFTRNTQTQLLLGDCWFQYQQFPEFVVRLGHFKAPFTLDDGFTSDNYTDFVERPMLCGSGAELAPDFHVGAMLYGTFGATKFGEGFFQYYLACQNQTQNNTPLTGDPLTTARVMTDIGGFVAGVAGCWENRSGIPAVTNPVTAPHDTELSFPGTTPGQFQFFAPVQVRGWTQRYTCDVGYYSGPFFAKGAFGYASQERWRVLADHSNGTALITQGADVVFGWMFWGPPASKEHPLSIPFQDWQLLSMDTVVKRNSRNVGAELLVMLEWLSIGEARGGRDGQNGVRALASTAPNADRVNGNECKVVAVGLNVYPIENVRLTLDYYHLRIGDQARSEKAHSRFSDEILMRAQLEF